MYPYVFPSHDRARGRARAGTEPLRPLLDPSLVVYKGRVRVVHTRLRTQSAKEGNDESGNAGTGGVIVPLIPEQEFKGGPRNNASNYLLPPWSVAQRIYILFVQAPVASYTTTTTHPISPSSVPHPPI